MGKHGFGKLAYVRHQVWHTLSPYELKPFAGYFSKGFPNLIRRVVQEAPYIIPPFLLGYGVYKYTVDKAVEMGRKQPGQFDNEENVKPAH